MRYAVLLLSLGIAAACGSPGEKGGSERQREPDGGPIGEAYIDSLERAEAVDELAKERQKRLDDAIEPPEG